MISGASMPGADYFLDGLNNTRAREATTQRQISSGFRLQTAADDPTQVTDLVSLNSSLAANQTLEQNFTRVKAELDTADGVLSSAISIAESARTIGLQGTSAAGTPETRQTLAAQVQSQIDQIVSLANTQVGGRYIFAGDAATTQPYQVDGAASPGYSYKGATTSTRQVLDGNGTPLSTSPTALDIFDHRDGNGQPDQSNLLYGLKNLADALLNNTGIQDAVTALQSTSSYLNQQQGAIGTGQNRLASALASAQSSDTQLRTRISDVRDTDVTQAAIDLNTEKVAESAALAAQSGMSRKSLFDYLG